MTVCIGAIVADGKAIVCVADKSITYGDFITGEADASKIVRLPSGVVVMVSGDVPSYERYMKKLGLRDTLGSDVRALIKGCEDDYLEMREELITIRHLQPVFMDKAAFHEQSLKNEQNEFVKSLLDTVRTFKAECSVLVGGFDQNGDAFLVGVEDPGEGTDYTRTGYHAIGSGWDYAVARLSCWADLKRTSPLDEALYFAVDAKISAEVSPFISGDWNASVITASGFHKVSVDFVDMLDRAWVQHSRSPYWKPSIDDLDDPPRNWRRRLKQWAMSITGEEIQSPKRSTRE